MLIPILLCQPQHRSPFPSFELLFQLHRILFPCRTTDVFQWPCDRWTSSSIGTCDSRKILHPKVLALVVKMNRTWFCIPHPRTIHFLLVIALPVYSSTSRRPHVCPFGKWSLYLEAIWSIFLRWRFREFVLLMLYTDQPVRLYDYAFSPFHL